MIHHADQQTIDEMYEIYSPVFILTTGRSGTIFLTRLLGLSQSIIPYHEPAPTLQYFSNFAFHNQKDEDVLTKMVDAARMELIMGVYIKSKTYVESNQCMTFFVPAIKMLFKNSKFIHIVRHPGDFVRSAVRKGWHVNDSIWESGRVQMADNEKWEIMHQIEKLSWVWNTTNEYINKFGEKTSHNRFISIKIEELFNSPRQVKQLFNFIDGSKVSSRLIKEVQKTKINELIIGPNEPPNMKKMDHFPKYKSWDESFKNKVKKHSQSLASFYNYEL
jgi:hypothetical protein